MAFGSTGVYAQLPGAITAAAGQTIQSSVWDAVHTDFGSSLTALGTCLVTDPVPRNALSANGGLEVWQRGAGGAASLGYTASATAYGPDRWYIATGANQAATISQQTGLIGGSQWCAQVQRNSSQTGTSAMTFAYPLDLDEIVRCRGKKVSLSFVAAGGANWSPASGTLVATLYTGTGSVQKAGAAAANFTGPTTVLTVPTNIPVSSGPVSVATISSAVFPAAATQAELQFTWTPTGTAGANDWFQLDDVMLDSSPAPGQGFQTAYERLPFDFQLFQCKRHFWKTFAYGTAPVQSAGAGTGELMGIAGKAAGTAQFMPFRNPVTLRATPGVTLYNPAAANAQVRDETAAADCSSSSGAGLTAEGGYISTTGNAGGTVGNLLGVHLIIDAGV